MLINLKKKIFECILTCVAIEARKATLPARFRIIWDGFLHYFFKIKIPIETKKNLEQKNDENKKKRENAQNVWQRNKKKNRTDRDRENMLSNHQNDDDDDAN